MVYFFFTPLSIRWPFPLSLPLSSSDIEYSYQVRHIPYMDYNSKQLLPHAPPTSNDRNWRLLRKRYSIRVEFQQAGSLGIV